ncbi:hypothetical protein HQ41_01435 [Porphyromonas sp. COT-290 OH860]|nr:hypothetical protein HQ41_01435 [Porphyromonas sp. COT-290 OH860]
MQFGLCELGCTKVLRSAYKNHCNCINLYLLSLVIVALIKEVIYLADGKTYHRINLFSIEKIEANEHQ